MREKVEGYASNPTILPDNSLYRHNEQMVHVKTRWSRGMIASSVCQRGARSAQYRGAISRTQGADNPDSEAWPPTLIRTDSVWLASSNTGTLVWWLLWGRQPPDLLYCNGLDGPPVGTYYLPCAWRRWTWNWTWNWTWTWTWWLRVIVPD